MLGEKTKQQLPTTQETVHLDHAASTVCPNSILAKVFKDWSTNFYANPHSQSLTSQYTSKRIRDVRDQVLTLFGTTSDTYDVIFTQNATHAMKIVGEYFPFKQGSEYICLHESSHNSLLGIREYCFAKGGQFGALTELEINLRLHQQNYEQYSSDVYNLFAYPAECNSTGKKYPLSWYEQIRSRRSSMLGDNHTTGKWYTLLDAAKYASTNVLTLGQNGPDFVAVSFYKMFGFPSGLGALLIRKDADILEKTYFSGGTVSVSAVDERFQELRKPIHERFEDGTIPFMNIIALGVIIEEFPRLFCVEDARNFIYCVNLHTSQLNSSLHARLSDLQHYNNAPVCEIYSSPDSSITNLNVLQPDGTYIGYSAIIKAANLYHINLRAGCFCNPGACSRTLNLTTQDLRNNFKQGHVCWDDNDIIEGRPTGSVRLSFGWSSTLSDVDILIEMITRCFLVTSIPNAPTDKQANRSPCLRLSNFIIYPLKSCHGIQVASWKLCNEGPLYDREWTLVDDKGVYLSQKHYPKMSLIKPSIDLQQGIMLLDLYPTGRIITLKLDYFPNSIINDCDVCGSKVDGLIYRDPAINDLLSEFLGVKCFLVRKNPDKERLSRTGQQDSRKSAIKFANDAQFLLVTRSSMDDLNIRLKTRYKDTKDLSGCNYENSDWLIDRFRPNLVVEGNLEPYIEDLFKYIRIGDIELEVIGGCNRCSMICVDQATLQVQNEPLKSLMQYRRNGSKVLFGVLLTQKLCETVIQERKIQIGDDVIPNFSMTVTNKLM
jgi:molybdenum cofactor sulfurtransferase